MIDLLTYEKLKIIMVKEKIEWKDLVKEKIITQDTRRLLVKDAYVDIKTLEKLANRFNVDIGDIVSIKKDPQD